MANEKAMVAEKTKATEQAAVTETVTAAEQAEKVTDSGLIVIREEWEGKEKRKFWGYKVKGKVRNKEIVANFVAYDQGGYDILDLIFDISDTAKLVINEGSMTDTETGEVRKFRTYFVQNVDENGLVFSYKVKPNRESDKSAIQFLINVGAAKVTGEA
ncbi:MAG: hypothetical protein IJU84_08395 [Clostridia bacterium]|nr:hypothetical protein [Clostridia bacterium]